MCYDKYESKYFKYDVILHNWVPSLKLTNFNLKIGWNPKGNNRLPTIHFQVKKTMLVSGRGSEMELRGCFFKSNVEIPTCSNTVRSLALAWGDSLIWGGYFNNPCLSYVQSYTNTNKMDLYQYKKKKGLNVAYFWVSKPIEGGILYMYFTRESIPSLNARNVHISWNFSKSKPSQIFKHSCHGWWTIPWT